MMQKSRSCSILLTSILLVSLVGCNNQTSSTNRSFESSVIVSGDSTTISVSGTSTQTTKQTFENTDLNLSVSDNLLVVDHGKDKASAYKVNCYFRPERWEGNDTWKKSWISTSWCYGHTFSSKLEEIPKDASELDGWVNSCNTISFYQASKNILNIGSTPVGEIPGISDIPSDVVDLPTKSELIVYRLNLETYPWELELSANKSFKTSHADMYHICSFVDEIPCGITAFSSSGAMGLGVTSSEFPTYEWPGVMKPASCMWPDGQQQYTNGDTIIEVDDIRYKIKETIVDQGDILSAQNCLKEVSNAIQYDMTYFTDKNIEVYSAELRYMLLREHPRVETTFNGKRWVWNDEEEFFLIPVWEYSMIVWGNDSIQQNTNQLLEQKSYRYTVYINALTGKSMYSDTHGPADPEYHPFLYDHEI